MRDRVEEIAADPAIDGRSRARYNRIDRRIFKNLLDALVADNLLGVNGPLLTDALALWHKYRNNRLPVPQKDLERMRELHDRFLANVG